MDLLKALSMAGGVLDGMADLQNVRIIRDDGTSTTVDLEQLLTSEPQQFVFLSSGDLVYVPSKERVSVSGHVMSPGEYRTRSSLGVSQALALAGGPIQDTANLPEALLFKPTGAIIEVDLSGYLRAGDAQNEIYVLDPGDALYVPGIREAGKVNILGYVHKPGQYGVKGPITLFKSLALAGGIANLREADLRKARITRENGVSEQIDLTSLGKFGSEGVSNIRSTMLYPGDTLEIYQKRRLINWSVALTVVSVISLTYNMIYNILR